MRKKWLPVIACSMILTLTACGMQENKRSGENECRDSYRRGRISGVSKNGLY